MSDKKWGINKIIKALGGTTEAVDFFSKLAKSEPATFTGKENEG